MSDRIFFLAPYIDKCKGGLFFSPEYGELKLEHKITDDNPNNDFVTDGNNVTYAFSTPNGSMVYYHCISVNNAGVGDIYPSRKLFAKFPFNPIRAWREWYDEDEPKTWEALEAVGRACPMIADTDYPATTEEEKSALALLKILQLIKKGYGGVANPKFWCAEYCVPVVLPNENNRVCWDDMVEEMHSPIVFESHELAIEFFSYESNIQLLKDFFMLND